MKPALQFVPAVSILDLLNQWRQYTVTLQCAHTARTYFSAVRLFLWRCGIGRAGDITRRAIQQYVVDSALAPASVQLHGYAIKAFCDWLVSVGHLSQSPYRDIKLPKRRKNALIVYLDKGELRRALSLARAGGYWLPVALAALAGLRKMEVSRLRWEDVDLSRKLLAIIDGKGKKSRLVPISAPLLAELSGGGTGRVCLNHVGSRHNHFSLHCLLDPIRAEIPKVGWSILRHSFASNMLQAGVPIATISKWLGHSSIATTIDFYASAGPDQYSDQINVLNALAEN